MVLIELKTVQYVDEVSKKNGGSSCKLMLIDDYARTTSVYIPTHTVW